MSITNTSPTLRAPFATRSRQQLTQHHPKTTHPPRYIHICTMVAGAAIRYIYIASNPTLHTNISLCVLTGQQPGWLFGSLVGWLVVAGLLLRCERRSMPMGIGIGIEKCYVRRRIGSRCICLAMWRVYMCTPKNTQTPCSGGQIHLNVNATHTHAGHAFVSLSLW